MKGCITLGAFLVWASPLASELVLTFDDPETFSDFEYATTRKTISVEHFRKEIFKQLERVVEKTLPEESKLALHFKDIDLAGGFEPWQFIPFDDVRFYRDRYPPRATLEYRLTDASGKVLSEGEVSLKDFNYQISSAQHNVTSNPFYYERRMLVRWIRVTLAKEIQP